MKDEKRKRVRKLSKIILYANWLNRAVSGRPHSAELPRASEQVRKKVNEHRIMSNRFGRMWEMENISNENEWINERTNECMNRIIGVLLIKFGCRRSEHSTITPPATTTFTSNFTIVRNVSSVWMAALRTRCAFIVAILFSCIAPLMWACMWMLACSQCVKFFGPKLVRVCMCVDHFYCPRFSAAAQIRYILNNMFYCSSVKCIYSIFILMLFSPILTSILERKEKHIWININSHWIWHQFPFYYTANFSQFLLLFLLLFGHKMRLMFEW